ncbi:MAG: hypothetical protein J6T10_02110 [Methanobrevibacter sp.]|nr:hypothetical protein [Methanobrevibacter sp.]MBO7691413.1 hypothetical protein [Methanobrevibacter sp.]
MTDRDYFNWLIDEKNDKIRDLEKENLRLTDEVDFWKTQATNHQKELIEKHDIITNQMKKIEELKEELKHWEE